MKMQNRNLIKWLILAAALWSPLGLQAQTFLSGDWTSSTVTVGVDANGTFLATAPLKSSITFNSTESSITNPQLLWVPAWGALRVGSFYNAPSATTMGQYSAAFGLSTASGSNSFSCGGSTASGENAIALGDCGWANNYDTVAIGLLAEATGSSAIAIGSGDDATGDSSMAIGNGSSAWGFCAIALGGGGAQASGSSSIAIGSNVGANGTYSTAMGVSTSANSYNSFVLGQYNVGLTEHSGTPSTTAWAATDPLFEIGNGPSWSAKSDALVIYKDGNAVFSPPAGTPTPPPGTPSCTVTAPAFVTTTASGDIPMYTGN